MYRLAHLLSKDPSGLYLLTGKGSLKAVGKLCQLKGARLFRIDGRSVQSKQRSLAVAGRALLCRVGSALTGMHSKTG
jgi:hypothetical protein